MYAAMRLLLFAAVRRECRPSLIQTRFIVTARQGPPETIQRRLFVHEYPCMAALGSRAAIVKSAGLFRAACRLPCGRKTMQATIKVARMKLARADQRSR